MSWGFLSVQIFHKQLDKEKLSFILMYSICKTELPCLYVGINKKGDMLISIYLLQGVLLKIKFGCNKCLCIGICRGNQEWIGIGLQKWNYELCEGYLIDDEE